MLKIKKIDESGGVIRIKITDSPRDANLVFNAGYITFASCSCPEFVGDVLYIWGDNPEGDGEILEVPTTFMPRLICAIAEFNNAHHATSKAGFINCCNHLWLEDKHCECQKGICHICGLKDEMDNMRTVEYGGKKYNLCKTHRKVVKCPVCDVNQYFMFPHEVGIQTCFDCTSRPVQWEKQHNYSFKPEPIFYHNINKQDVLYSFQTMKNKRGLKTKLWTGHEVEQQFPESSHRELLIGRMKEQLGDLIYCKSDGSIGTGTECVTHPFSWEYFKRKDWAGILNPHIIDWRKSSNSVGHHVHMNIQAFGRLHMYKFLKFHHTHLKWVEFISQRPLVNYCLPTGGSMQKALNRRGGDKYEFINVTSGTIEWRAFASPITIEEFLKNCEYIFASYEWSKSAYEKEMSSESLEEYILQHTKHYPNLIAYITREKEKYPLRHTANVEHSYRTFTTREQRQEQRRTRPVPTPTTRRCDCCGEESGDLIRLYNSNRTSTHHYCPNCFDEHTNHCEHCDDSYIGESFYDEYDNEICESCYHDLESESDSYEEPCDEEI
jgi:hypothetical protein